MKKKYYWVIGIIIIVFMTVWILSKNSIIPTNTTETSICGELANKLDAVIEDTNNPPGRFIISGLEGIVGGVLTNIEDHGFNTWTSFYDYELTFKGKNKEGKLYLITKIEQELPYEIGQFYKFDFANIRKSGELSGSFIDNNLDKLIFVSCE